MLLERCAEVGMTRMLPISWAGIDAEGQAVAGEESVEAVSAFVQAKYEAGWAELTVELRGREGIAGEIFTEKGRRTYWGEPPPMVAAR